MALSYLNLWCVPRLFSNARFGRRFGLAGSHSPRYSDELMPNAGWMLGARSCQPKGVALAPHVTATLSAVTITVAHS